MSNFSKAKKYLTKKEIDERVKMLMTKSEETILALKEETFSLKVQLEKLQKENLELKRREKIISKALFEAIDNSRSEVKIAETKRKSEIAMLEEFLAKWVVLISNMNQKESKTFERDFLEIIQSLKTGAGKAEISRRRELEMAKSKLVEANSRLKKSNKEIDDRYSLILEKYKKIKGADVAEFDLEEALNPSLTLEEIMKDIFKSKNKK